MWWIKMSKTMRLIVAQGHDHPRLFSKGLIAKQLHWVNREPVRECVPLYGENTLSSTRILLVWLSRLMTIAIRVIFDEPQAAVTPGQSAVFYLDEICLGGGIIEERIK